MDDYNFWKDLFDTYQSLTDWVKVAWLIVPPLYLLGLIALFMHFRLASKRALHAETETLAYTVYSGRNGRLRIYAHDGKNALPDRSAEQPLLPQTGAQPRALGQHPPSDI